jgi:hypothetical protein
MNGEENIDQVPKSSDIPEDGNENASQELRIEQSKTQSENMEVHHHADLHHKRKNFKEYFLEFLMIFLAVTLGFFAENLREGFNDREHKKGISAALIRDLERDTLILQTYIKSSVYKLNQIDSLYRIVQQPINKIDSFNLQRLVVAAALQFSFVPSNGTIAELKSTGLLRLFAYTKIPSLISQYEARVNLVKYVENYETEYQKKYIEGFMEAHFTPENMYRSADSTYLHRINFIPVNNNLRNPSQDNLTQFCVDLMLYKTYGQYVLVFYQKTYQMDNDFIRDIQKEK